MLRRQRLDVGILQDVETLGIGLHQAVFDAVMDHLDEMPGADRAGVDVALLDARIAALAVRSCAGCRRCRAPALQRSDRAGRPRPCRRRSSCNSRARCPRRRRRCRHRHNGCRAPCSALPRRTSSCQKVLPPSMMTSPACISFASVVDGRFGDLAGRQHHPGGARLLQLGDEFFQRAARRPRPRRQVPRPPWDPCRRPTVVWPCFISRRTMLPPIRPRPIMPSCIRLRFP